MKNIFNKIIVILLIFISPSIAADKYKINPYTSRLDNTGPFTAGTLTGGSYCTYDAGTDSIICTSAGSGSTLPGGGQNAVQRNNGGTFTGDETQFSSNGTNVGIGTTNGNALFSINSTANQSLFRIDDNGINDASPAIYVKADGNVGIGTTNPMTNFQVGGGGVTAGAEIEILSAAPELGLTETDTSKFWEIWVNSSTLRFSDSSDRMVIEGTNGNVGINTAIPPNKLYVAGTIEGNGFKLNGQNGAAGSVLVSGSTGIGTWMAPSSIGAGGGSGTVSSGTADRVAIYDTAGTTITSSSVITDDNTNVGIGSTAPQSKLVVNQGVSASNTPLMVYANNNSFAEINIQNLSNGASASSDFVATSDNGTATTNYIDMGVNGSGGGAAPFTGANHGYIYTSNFPLNVGAIGSNSYITFNTGATPTEYMRVDQAGNVGIASVNPIQKLDVIGTVKATALRATAISGSTQCVQADTNGNLSGTGSACGGAGSTPGGGQNAVQYNNASAFAGSEAVFSMNGTNVGINTTNGVGALDVRSASTGLPSNNTTGNLRLIDTTAFAPGTGGELIFGGYYTATDLASNATGIKTEKRNAASGDYGFGMSFWTRVNGDVPTRRMIVADDGNVGVGTAIPVTKFEVAGTSRSTGFQLNLAPLAGGNVLVSNTVGVGTWMSPTTLPSGGGSGTVNSGVVNQVTYYASTGTAVSGSTAIGTDNTNVGIGTTSFTNRLNVLGNIGLGTTAYDAYVTQTVPSGSIAIQGNLGIGTFNPTGRFQLNNGVVTGGVLVSGSTGIGTWMSATTLPVSGGTSNWFTQAETGGNVGVGTYTPVGIGTSFGNGSLVVMPGNHSGNVGIGTWNPTATLSIKGTSLIDGTATLAENASIALDPAGSADGKYTGMTLAGTAGYAQSFGDLVYLDPTDSRWEKTDANATAGADGDSRGIIGMVVVAGGSDGAACTILLNGIIRADAAFPAMTINAPMFISETAGVITGTVPTTTDAVMRVIGFAITTDEIRFDPSSDYATHI